MDIGFFINYKEEVIQLPVNPEKITVIYKGNNSTTEIIQLGDINILKDRKLAELSFSSFFPEYSWFPGIRTLGGFKGPAFYKAFFQRIQEEKQPCRLIVTGLDINMKCSVESFDYYHQGGDHEDAYYSLSFKEYRDYEITEIAVDPSLKRSTVTPSTPPTTTTTTSTTPGSVSGNTDTSSTNTSDKTSTGTTPPAAVVPPAKITRGCYVICSKLFYDSPCTQAVPTSIVKVPAKARVEHVTTQTKVVGNELVVDKQTYAVVLRTSLPNNWDVTWGSTRYYARGENTKLYGT